MANQRVHYDPLTTSWRTGQVVIVKCGAKGLVITRTDQPELVTCPACREAIDDDDDRTCRRCGDVCSTLSSDNLCDSCVADDDDTAYEKRTFQ